ncbi:MAG: alpha/beta hydrolase [Spirochaetales bacterium]|nr:alpha/beta hydrolase [Spirochaetales bacterium]
MAALNRGMIDVVLVSYKNIGDFILRMHVIRPVQSFDTPRPAVIFFFCGAWTAFDATKFFPQSTYLASRGMVCFNAEVRVEPIHGTTAIECVMDAKSAVRWVRANAASLGITPDRVTVSGGSAAGHVAACCGVVDGFDDPADASSSISSKPDAMVLFNPTLDTISLDRRIKRFGGLETARSLSPLHNVRPGAPPSLVMHGRADELVDVDETIRFGEAMVAAGNHCDVRLYENQGHGFFNYFDGGNPMFTETLREMDAFLVRQDFFDGKDRIDSFTITNSL